MTTPRRGWRSTIRVRLTMLYAVAFFLAGAMLVALMYVFLGQALERQLTARVGITQHVPESTATEPAAQQRAHEVQPELRAQFERDRDDTLNTMLIASLVALGVVVVAAGGFGWLLAGRALHPLQQITATARRVADRSLHERIALDGPHDEIKDLADTFDAMLERLDRSFDSQRRFVANASHELRTPLTINRTLIEVALDDPQADESLRQLGANLLDIAIRYNLSEHREITVTTETTNGYAQLAVENTGRPVPAYEIPTLFEPFRRAPTSERRADSTSTPTGRGAGRGLSIVRSVAHAHGGDVDASPRKEGGLTVRVRLPAARVDVPHPS